MNRLILSVFFLFGSFTSMAGDIDFNISPPSYNDINLSPPPPPLPDNSGSNITIEPTMIPSSTIPGTPNPPHNPSQAPNPSTPGVSITIPY